MLIGPHIIMTFVLEQDKCWWFIVFQEMDEYVTFMLFLACYDSLALVST